MTAPRELQLHGIAGAPGTRLARLLGPALERPVRFRRLVSAFDRVVVDVSGPVEAAGLPDGAASAEAAAVRARRSGAAFVWGEPRHVERLAELLDLCHARGRSSIAIARADPSLVPELQLGTWFDGSRRLRFVRRVWAALRVCGARAAVTKVGVEVAADAAFWSGVRAAATRDEWHRLTRSSYVALVYHRLAGERKIGQERVDLAPHVFDRQLRLLRLLRFHPVDSDVLLAFHEDPAAVLPRRSYIVTLDDGFRDVYEPLLRHAALRPLLFVSTQEVGGTAHWLDGEPVLDWDEVRTLARAGTVVGSHAREHRRLTEVGDSAATDLARSRAELRTQVMNAVDVLAYPHGDHDDGVRAATRAAGFRAAFTTEKGRNGAGTDRYVLRRVSVHAADGALAVLWKVATGEALPRWWERLRGAMP